MGPSDRDTLNRGGSKITTEQFFFIFLFYKFNKFLFLYSITLQRKKGKITNRSPKLLAREKFRSLLELTKVLEAYACSAIVRGKTRVFTLA